MSVMFAVIVGLLMGAVFGLALEKSKVMEPGCLVGQFQFRNFTMLKVMLTAVATGLVVLGTLNGLGIVALSVKPALVGNMVMGGLLLGVGIVVAGACPGTAMAQVGAGYKDAWAVVAGGLVGALTYGVYQKPIDRALDWSGAGLGNFGKMTLADLLPGGFTTLAFATAGLIVIGLIALERARPWRQDMACNDPTVPGTTGAAGGLTPGLAPAE